jgi:hypothetical protein
MLNHHNGLYRYEQNQNTVEKIGQNVFIMVKLSVPSVLLRPIEVVQTLTNDNVKRWNAFYS